MNQFEKGTQFVNRCTPKHHLRCIYITGIEVYKDGASGKSTRHWWRMSYIGRACANQYGNFLGNLYEAFFAVPHYIAIAAGNMVGLVAYVLSKFKKQ